VVEKPRLIAGFLAFLMFIPLAGTSFDIWKKRLGKNWKRLHQTVYVIAPIVVLHYAWSKKGDLFTLQGEIVRPLIYGLIVVIFLIMRIPSVRKILASLQNRIRLLLKKWTLQPKTDSH
jgi:sulfoxide reductase heme-binding subunit YedZ